MENVVSEKRAYQAPESDSESTRTAPDESGLNLRSPLRPNATRFHGPQFISNLEGLVLAMKADSEGTVLSRSFTGDRNQQWLLQFDPNGTGSVAIASLQDGRYLTPRPLDQTIVAIRTPYHWDLLEHDKGRYSLIAPTGGLKLTVPTPPGPCTVSYARADNEDVNLIIVENTSDSQAALKTGAIGPLAYPGAPVYYTHGSSGYITVRNHLNTKLYGAVSGSGSNAQWVIQPGNYQYWGRSANASVHLSTPINENGEQSVQVYEGRVGKTLHIQNLESQEVWTGVKYVSPNDATYTENPSKRGAIGVKNDLAFDIHVSVFSTLQNGDTSQYIIRPGSTDYWNRDHLSEMVFVGVGSAPGFPTAYVGRPGFILHVDRW